VTVPRQPVGNVTEHRVTLGDFERRELSGFIAAREKDQDLELVLDVVRATAQPLAIVSASYLFYLGITNWGTAIDVVKNWWTGYVAESKAATTVEDVVTSDLFTVEGQADGPGGGGGASQGVFGGSVFM